MGILESLLKMPYLGVSPNAFTAAAVVCTKKELRGVSLEGRSRSPSPLAPLTVWGEEEMNMRFDSLAPIT
jgi:hypothetical protein